MSDSNRDYFGVRPRNNRWLSFYTDRDRVEHKLGSYKSPLEAAQSYDQYMVDHNIRRPLNRYTECDFREGLKHLEVSLSDLLYPNTPIEVVVEEINTRTGDKVPAFILTAEGQWQGNEITLKGAKARVREILQMYQELWASKSGYDDPDWHKWGHINHAGLHRAIGVSA